MTRLPDLPALAAALEWQIELGADEAIAETPIDRFAENAAAQKPAQRAVPSADKGATPVAAGSSAPRGQAAPPAPVAEAVPAVMAPSSGNDDVGPAIAAAPDLAALAAAGEAIAAPTLKPGARRFVFADGHATARLMIIGEAPGADEDREGRPFVGRAGQLLDLMLGAIGLDRSAEDPSKAVYITNILPWRPPANRAPSEGEIEAFLPLVERHVALVAPERLLILGNTPLKALTGGPGGITRARGRWQSHQATGVPFLPSFHPAYLLRQPAKKREAWADLLTVAAALDLPPVPPLPS